MKTTLKNFMVIVAIFISGIILSSCTKDTEIDISLDEESTKSFTAKMETSVSTKTSLSSKDESTYNLVWTDGDCISIDDGSTTAFYSTHDNNTTSASFTCVKGNLDPASTYTAFYPSSITKDNMVLPSKQEYVNNNVKEFPMYAKSSNSTFLFKNLCGIARFDIIDGDDAADYSISEIHLSCEGKGLSGQFTIDNNTAVVSGDDGVSLICKTEQELSSSKAKVFNIVVPAEDYDNLKVVIVFSDGTERTYKSDGIVKVKRSCITRYAISVKASEMSGSLELIPIEDGEVDFSER